MAIFQINSPSTKNEAKPEAEILYSGPLESLINEVKEAMETQDLPRLKMCAQFYIHRVSPEAFEQYFAPLALGPFDPTVLERFLNDPNFKDLTSKFTNDDFIFAVLAYVTANANTAFDLAAVPPNPEATALSVLRISNDKVIKSANTSVVDDINGAETRRLFHADGSKLTRTALIVIQAIANGYTFRVNILEA
jgi:hypothetical protein